MSALARKLIDDRRGTTAVEYALIGLLICVAIVAAVTEAGLTVSTIMTQVAAGFAN
jgi:Flp pilus assembly pilin Flp